MSGFFNDNRYIKYVTEQGTRVAEGVVTTPMRLGEFTKEEKETNPVFEDDRSKLMQNLSSFNVQTNDVLFVKEKVPGLVHRSGQVKPLRYSLMVKQINGLRTNDTEFVPVGYERESFKPSSKKETHLTTIGTKGTVTILNSGKKIYERDWVGYRAPKKENGKFERFHECRTMNKTGDIRPIAFSVNDRIHKIHFEDNGFNSIETEDELYALASVLPQEMKSSDVPNFLLWNGAILGSKENNRLDVILDGFEFLVYSYEQNTLEGMFGKLFGQSLRSSKKGSHMDIHVGR